MGEPCLLKRNEIEGRLLHISTVFLLLFFCIKSTVFLVCSGLFGAQTLAMQQVSLELSCHPSKLCLQVSSTGGARIARIFCCPSPYRRTTGSSCMILNHFVSSTRIFEYGQSCDSLIIKSRIWQM